jgi:CRISPR-associated exonuclease Cas4
MSELIRLTDLKNWAYCARVVFYHRTMPEAAPMTGKMRSGLQAQELVERLELRRTLERYGFEQARRVTGSWLTDDDLGLSGRVDLALVDEARGEGAVVDYKLTSGEPGDNHRMQLHGYAMLVESAYPGVKVTRGFLYRIPDDRVFAIPIEARGRERVVTAVREIREMAREQALPEATEVRGRCEDCEFANYCGDVW